MKALLKAVCLFFLLFSRANAVNPTAPSWRFVEQELCIKPQKELRKRWADYIVGCLGVPGGYVCFILVIGYIERHSLYTYHKGLNRRGLWPIEPLLMICGGLVGFYSWNYKLWRTIQFEALKSFLDCWDRNKRRIPEELFSTLESCHRVYASGEKALKKITPTAMKKIRKRIQDHQREVFDEIGLN